jgi:hypothetical protein
VHALIAEVEAERGTVGACLAEAPAGLQIGPRAASAAPVAATRRTRGRTAPSAVRLRVRVVRAVDARLPDPSVRGQDLVEPGPPASCEEHKTCDD